MDNILTKALNLMNAKLDASIDDLKKSGTDLVKAERADGTYGRKGLLFEPFAEQTYVGGGLYKAKQSYLSNEILRQVSRRDPVVAAIIDVRCSQVAAACKKPADRFDIGFKLIPKDKTVESDPKEVRQIEEFILNCGLKSDRRPEDKLTFDSFGYMVTRDFMTIGHAAVEKIVRNNQQLHSFLPLDAATIYYANKKASKKDFKALGDSYSNLKGMDSKDKIVDKDDDDNYEYVQVMRNRVEKGFTSKELAFVKYQMETDIDLAGYCVSPLERAISTVTSHLQVENHQRQFFNNGIAAKGLLVIQGDVTPNALRALQAQWSQTAAGPLSAWKTPILSGINGVQWVPLTSSNRDMEFANYYNTLLIQMFACFGMDPEEAGFGMISKGVDSKAMSESSNEWKITASRDRGLRPILGRFETLMNEEILPAYNKQFSEKYHFVFVGLDSDDKNEELQHLQQATQLHTTINEARKISELEPMNIGGQMILNPLLIQTLRSSMPFGLFCEKFLGLQGYSERPDLQFFDNPSWFQWAQMQQAMMQQQAMGMMQPQGDDSATTSNKKQGDKKGSKDESGGEQGDDGAEAQQAQMAAQAQAMAVQQYIAANPELFKAYNDKMDLMKSEQVSKIDTSYLINSRDRLVGEFQQVSDWLVKEILEAVEGDIKKDK